MCTFSSDHLKCFNNVKIKLKAHRYVGVLPVALFGVNSFLWMLGCRILHSVHAETWYTIHSWGPPLTTSVYGQRATVLRPRTVVQPNIPPRPLSQPPSTLRKRTQNDAGGRCILLEFVLFPFFSSAYEWFCRLTCGGLQVVVCDGGVHSNPTAAARFNVTHHNL